jgi:formate hydrogenlyase subunit 6/NADH:ubiquinone oxidoreductase subunit I
LAKKWEGYLYAARPDWYLKPTTWPWFMHRFAATESADTYHGKLLTQEDASKLIQINKPINLIDLDQVIPYPTARSIILQDPLPSLAVVDCPCRAQKQDACLPRDVCLVVGEPYTSFVLDHQPDKSRRITAEEALDIIDAEEKRGHIHTAWFKDVMHNRFYTICNCCSCCCLGMKSYYRGVPRLTHSGYSPSFNNEVCLSCGTCVHTCPFQAIKIENEFPVINVDLCMGCGLCVSHCPTDAVKLVLAPHKGIPLNIEQLVQ